MAASEAKALASTHPAMLVATVCGVGLLPKAPGTWGSLVSLPFAWLVARAWGSSGLLLGAAVLFALGWWAAARITRGRGGDPQFIVIDEAAGQFLALATVPLDPLFFAAAFVLFRLFDVAKPFPVGWADRHIGGGFGVMFDDVLAALYAVAVLLIARLLLGR